MYMKLIMENWRKYRDILKPTAEELDFAVKALQALRQGNDEEYELAFDIYQTAKHPASKLLVKGEEGFDIADILKHMPKKWFEDEDLGSSVMPHERSS